MNCFPLASVTCSHCDDEFEFHLGDFDYNPKCFTCGHELDLESASVMEEETECSKVLLAIHKAIMSNDVEHINSLIYDYIYMDNEYYTESIRQVIKSLYFLLQYNWKTTSSFNHRINVNKRVERFLKSRPDLVIELYDQEDMCNSGEYDDLLDIVDHVYDNFIDIDESENNFSAFFAL
jgi:hypothetical protein